MTLQLSVYVCLPVFVFVNCMGWVSHERSGMGHRIEGLLDGLQYKQVLQNVMVPSVKNALSRMVQSISSKTAPFMILVWFKKGYRCRPTSNSVTGHRERLI